MELSYKNLEQTLVASISEIELVKAIKQLQQNFTLERQKIEDYLTSELLVSAYTLFYLPTNFPKLGFMLDQLSSAEKEGFLACDFIDIGTGPGTYLLAFLDQLKEIRQKIVGIDRSGLMLAQAQRCLNYFFGDVHDVVLRDHLPVDFCESENQKVICFGHSLNEMKQEAVEKLLEKSKADYVLIIEPGTPASFVRILELSKRLQAGGYGILYPCPESIISCPMEGSTNWCHQVLRMSHDPSIERIAQMAHFDRRSMPMVIHLYKKNYKYSMQGQGRLIRITRETKFSFELEVCVGTLQLLEVFKKSLSKQEIKKLRALSHGVTLGFEKVKELSDRWRVELTSF